MTHLTRTLITTCLFYGLTAVLHAKPVPAALFGDNAVLQQDTMVTIWGKADPGEDVTVSFDSRFARARADANGAWMVKLPVRANATGDLVFKDSSGQWISSNVVSGDVWLCSGQSNMEWTVGKTKTVDADKAAADLPAIRHFKVKPQVSTEPSDEVVGAWEVCSPQSVARFTAAGYHFARELQKHYNRPQGIINSTWGGTSIETWSSETGLESDPVLKPVIERNRERAVRYPGLLARYKTELADWEARKAAADKNGLKFNTPKPKAPADSGPTARGMNARAFNAMINPLTPSTIRGVLWYQGEANWAHPEEYETLLKALILDWRRRWSNQALPFYIVQLPDYGSPTIQTWAILRKAQADVAKIPNVGVAITIGLGDAKDIHGSDKREIGRRLSLLVRRDLDGEKLHAAAPLPESVRAVGRELIVKFSDDKLVLKDMPESDKMVGFEVAGDDGNFVAAAAELKNGLLYVGSPDITAPRSVRYAWRDNPAVVLYDQAGFPVAPFSADIGPL